MGRHSVAGAVRAGLRRMGGRLGARDAGSATMAGVALVCAAALLLGLIASGGNIVLRRGQARTVADLATVGAAQALWYGETETPCVLAGHIASANARRHRVLHGGRRRRAGACTRGHTSAVRTACHGAGARRPAPMRRHGSRATRAGNGAFRVHRSAPAPHTGDAVCILVAALRESSREGNRAHYGISVISSVPSRHVRGRYRAGSGDRAAHARAR